MVGKLCFNCRLFADPSLPPVCVCNRTEAKNMPRRIRNEVRESRHQCTGANLVTTSPQHAVTRQVTTIHMVETLRTV